jgi:HAD superfamily hydrolase (TIGR01450 family)
MKLIQKLRRVKLFLFDMDGTLYLSDRLLPGAKELLSFLRENGKPFCLVTNNSSVGSGDYIRKLHRLGIDITPKEVWTSGLSAAAYFRKNLAGVPVFVLGTELLKAELSENGVNVTDNPGEARAALVGFDTNLTYLNLKTFCGLVRDGLPFFATHYDINCPTADGYIPDVGSFLRLIEASTGRAPDVIFGKPFAPMTEGLKERFSELALSNSDIAMTGDRLMTDMDFAVKNGFLSVLVLSGETDEAMLARSGLEPDIVLKGVNGFLEP